MRWNDHAAVTVLLSDSKEHKWNEEVDGRLLREGFVRIGRLSVQYVRNPRVPLQWGSYRCFPK